MDENAKDGDRSTSVEVERKFLFDGHCEKKLVELGARLVSQRSFSDVYYDNGSCDLMLNDHWLRRRDGAWQLKCPPPDGSGVDHRDTLHYAEYERPSAILARLRSVLERRGTRPVEVPAEGDAGAVGSREQIRDDDHRGAELESFIGTREVKPVASFRTDRTKYGVGQDIVVDLDVTDFGYSIGEIEVMASGEEQRGEATKKINDFAEKLGVGGERKIPGKLIIYLSRRRPEVYSLIRRAFRL